MATGATGELHVQDSLMAEAVRQLLFLEGFEDRFQLTVADRDELRTNCARCGDQVVFGFCVDESCEGSKHHQECPCLWFGNKQMETEEPCNCGAAELYAAFPANEVQL